MSAALVLPHDSELFRTLDRAARERRCIFFAGLPGTGKSLLLQQTMILAHRAGRAVSLVQWDVARSAFETPAILGRYPEVNGVTHAAIRAAAGRWIRTGVTAWHRRYPDPRHLLVGEAPFVGGRLTELARPADDAAEPLLASAQTLFLVPAPDRAVRQVIEAARVRDMANPRHAREEANAPPDLVQAHWREIAALAPALGITTQIEEGYDPAVYAAVYLRLLRYRHAASLAVTGALPVRASAYEREGVIAEELIPGAEEVARAMASVEACAPAAIERAVADWFSFARDRH